MGRPAVRVGFDANVLIAGIRLPRWPHEVLRAALTWRLDSSFVLVLPEQVIVEARRHLLGTAQQDALDYFLSAAAPEIVPFPSLAVVRQNLDLVRSEKDVPIAVALLESRVDVFVTNDRDFTEEAATAERFRHQVQVLLPPVFLRDVLHWESAALEAIRFRTWPDLLAADA